MPLPAGLESAWLSDVERFALCPIVEGALVRYLLRLGETGRTAHAVLDCVRSLPHAIFWPDDLSYATLSLTELRGHRQVTDAYLAALAEAHSGLLATFEAPSGA